MSARPLIHFAPVAVIFLLAALGGCGQQTAPTQLPRNARPLHYSISVVPDAAALRFSASAVIDIDVLQRSDSVTLNAADLDFQSVRLKDKANQTIEGSAAVDAKNQTATFRFPSPLVPGRYSLLVDYTGKISRQANGLFALDYDTSEGRKRALFTQFEAADARRFMPCWDEPSFRASFDLRVTVPNGQMAIGNMPESSRVTKPDGGSE